MQSVVALHDFGIGLVKGRGALKLRVVNGHICADGGIVKRFAQQRDQFMHSFMDEFYGEWDSTR